jgi:hypothetical protein
MYTRPLRSSNILNRAIVSLDDDLHVSDWRYQTQVHSSRLHNLPIQACHGVEYRPPRRSIHHEAPVLHLQSVTVLNGR